MASFLGGGICTFRFSGKIKINGNDGGYTKIENNKTLFEDQTSNPSEGIYLASDAKLEIEGNTLINKNNDVYLEPNAFINVTNKLNKINKENPISITSEEENIEDEKTEGTKLVEYSEAAGGEAKL